MMGDVVEYKGAFPGIKVFVYALFPYPFPAPSLPLPSALRHPGGRPA